MKSFLLLHFGLVLSLGQLTLQAQDAVNISPAIAEKAALSEWTNYGEAITLQSPVTVRELLKKQKKEKEVLLEGTISEVCQNKGCWMVVGDEKQSVRVEFKDYKYFVPWDSEGKKVRLQGKLITKGVSAAAAKHMAGEMKNSPVRTKEIKPQQSITVFMASGVAIENGSAMSEEQKEIIEGKKSAPGHEEEQEHHDGHKH